MQKRNKYVAIIQARVGSSRLPGKCLLPLGDCDSVIEYIVKNISLSEYIDEICIAFPNTFENEKIKEVCNTIKGKYNKPIYWYAGSENNVLDRITQAANYFKVANENKLSENGELFAVEITADCPFVSAFTIDTICKCIEVCPEIDYMSNTVTRCWPDGFDVQIYRIHILNAANKLLLEDNKHREHGGWNIVNYSLELITCSELHYCPTIINYAPMRDIYFHPEWSVTLDTKEDYVVICDIIALLGENYDRNAIDVEVLMLLMKDPSVLDKNKNIRRNIPGV